MDAFEPKYTHVEKPKSNLNCLLIGCLGVVLLTVGGITATIFGGYFFVRGQINKYTADAPAEIPESTLSKDEVAQVKERLELFSERLDLERLGKNGDSDDGDSDDTDANATEGELEPLILTADEINALIQDNEELKGKVFVEIDEGMVSGEVSMPLDGIPMAGGRYFNASVTFSVELDDGELMVNVDEAEVNGSPVPEEIMSEIRNENFAAEVNGKTRRLIRKFEAIRIEENRIVLIPAKPQPKKQDEEEGGSEESQAKDGSMESDGDVETRGDEKSGDAAA